MVPSGSGGGLTAAGWWYVAVSVPVFQFLVYRWLWRGAVWTGFLQRVARLDLRLVASHPHRAGGLGGQQSFAIVAFAVAAVGSARFAQQILHAGAHVADFKMVLGGFVAIATVVVFAPLAVFAPRLTALRRESHGEYSRLAGGHHRAFEARWLRRDDAGSELLGSPDVSSLADLDTAFQNVTALRTFPVDRRNVAVVAVAAALPMVPLVMLEIPVAEILRRILGILA